jgi:hypothetical protein
VQRIPNGDILREKWVSYLGMAKVTYFHLLETLAFISHISISPSS